MVQKTEHPQKSRERKERGVKYLFVTWLSILLNICPEMKLLDQMTTIVSWVFGEGSRWFPQQLLHVPWLSVVHKAWASQLLHALTATCLCRSPNSHPDSCELITSRLTAPWLCFVVTCVSSLGKRPSKPSAHFWSQLPCLGCQCITAVVSTVNLTTARVPFSSITPTDSSFCSLCPLRREALKCQFKLPFIFVACPSGVRLNTIHFFTKSNVMKLSPVFSSGNFSFGSKIHWMAFCMRCRERV